MEFFRTEKEACKKASEMNEIGLCGSGQVCGPEYTDHGWYYHTAHNAFSYGEPVGKIILVDCVLENDEVTNFIGKLLGY
jgi:hypothetical protein